MAAPPPIEEPRVPGSLLPWIAVFGFAIAAGIAARFLVLDRLSYEIWADRDLSRAEEMLRRPWFTGAEFDRGGRTPGGFYYLLLRVYLMLGEGPTRVHLGTIALDVIAMTALAGVTWRRVGWPAGLAVAAFYACSPAVLGLLRIAAYNPTNAVAFGVLAHAFFLEALLGGRRGALPPTFFFIALAAQIHFSYALLIPLFALTLAVQRVRIGGRVWAFAFLAFVAAYVPYLVADGLAGWPNTREIGQRQDVLAAPAALAFVRNAPLKVQPRTDALATVLIGLSPGVATPWRTLGSFTLYRVGAWRLFPVMMVASFLIYGAWSWMRGRPAGSRAVGRAASAALLIVGAGLVLLSMRNTSFVVRYLLFIVPAVALLHGCAFQAYADALAGTRSSWRKTLLNVVLLYWAALCANANTLWWSALLQTPLVTEPRWERLVGDLQRDMGFGSRDVLTRVTLVNGQAPLSLLGPTEGAGAYLVRTFADGRASDAQGRCAIVLLPLSTGPPITASDIPRAITLLPPDPPLRDVQAVAARGDVTIVSYRLESGSCYHNLNDRYVLTPEEEVIAAAAVPGDAAAPSAAKEVGGGSGRRFVVTLPSRNPKLGPLRLMVEVETSAGMVSAALHSNELRGYDGLSSFRARGTALVLQGEVRDWRIPIYEGTLGGWFTPALTPWRSAPMTIPAGTYRAELAIDDLAFLDSGGSEGARRVPLTDALVIPPPPKSPPATTAPGPPDDGRGSEGTPPPSGTDTRARAPR